MKGIRSLDMSVSDVAPGHASDLSLLQKSSDQSTAGDFRPSKMPLRGATELSQAERHSAHLRKRRQRKVERREGERRLEVMARFDEGAKRRVERGKVMQTLAGNKQVTVVGGGKAGGGKGKWKHDLTATLAKDRQAKSHKDKSQKK